MMSNGALPTRTLSLVSLLPVACGLLMVAAVGVGSHGATLVAATLAVAAVLAGAVFRPFATLAVLLTVAVIVLSNPAVPLVAISGLSAAVYLALRHAAATGTGLDTVGGATMVGAVGFTFVGLVATAFPLRLAWMPLLAPLAVFAIYLLATRPFLRDD